MMMFSQIWAVFASGAAIAAAVGGCNGVLEVDHDPEVASLVKRAADAHNSLMKGDIETYRKAIQVTSDFILMDPFGGDPTGAPTSDAHWQRIGRFFKAGHNATFHLIKAYRSVDLVILVAHEAANVAVGSLPPQDWLLRVTLVFRRDQGVWRLAHRHADPLVRRLTLEQAGKVTLGSF
jgi:ketosteroid isomerase-like protein